MARRDPPGHDPSRREFFRTFSRQTVQGAGAVAGAAAELRRTSLAAARELFDTPTSEATTDERRTVVVADEGLSEPTFRSAYRFTGESLVILDQRELPDRALTFECRNGAAVASAVRSGAITAGPVLAEVAAYGTVLAALEAVDRDRASREQRVRGACGALRSARREQAALALAVDRMEARYDSFMASADTTHGLVHALRDEADAVAFEALSAHAAMGRLLSDALQSRASERGNSIDVLVHGDTGPLSHGTVGPSTAAFQSLLAAGRPLHVWITTASPSDEGVRVTAHTLAQHDVPHTLIPDAAVGWLLANRSLTGVIVRGDTVFENGDVLSLIGARSVAVLSRQADVPLFVLAPRAAHDSTGSLGSGERPTPRSPAESGGALRARLNPITDVVPAELVTTVVSEDAERQ
jgi:methylthioribose-1-phosphate isomerase